MKFCAKKDKFTQNLEFFNAIITSTGRFLWDLIELIIIIIINKKYKILMKVIVREL